jgi:hypothetical protein
MRNNPTLLISILSSLLLCGCSGLVDDLAGAMGSSGGDEAGEADQGAEGGDGDHGEGTSSVATASVSADGTAHASVDGVSAHASAESSTDSASASSGAEAVQTEAAVDSGSALPPRPDGDMPWDRSGPSLSAIDVGESVSILLESCQMHLEGGNRDWAEAACLSGIKKGKARDYSRIDRLYYRLGRVYESAGRKDDAVLAYHEALRQNSDNKYAQKRLDKLTD